MKFIYLNAKTYPGSTADHYYVRNLAYSFQKVVGDGFTFVGIDMKAEDLPGLRVVSVNPPFFIKKTIVFFFWLPWFYIQKIQPTITRGEPAIFFSNDFNLLTLLIFWKKLLRLSYVVAADWHLLTNTWKDAFVARNADYSFTTSLKLENTIKKMAPNARVTTVYGGVDLAPFEKRGEIAKVRTELGLPPDTFLVGYVGLFKTMGMEKGISTMIEALPVFPSSHAMVFVGGKDAEIDFYKEKAEIAHVLHRCIFVPLQNFETVVKYEQAMDVLVIPYPDKPHFRDYGFPMKIYEYMASGVAIVYTKLELLEEIVADCAYGIVPDSPHALKAALIDIYENREDARAKSAVAKEKVKGLTWDAKAMNILATFDILQS